MDILIRGMKMPTKGEYHMTLYVCDDGYAYMDVDVFPVDRDRFEVVPVPEQWRLKRRVVYRGDVFNALESARIIALDGILTDRYKDGFHDGLKRALEILANDVQDVLIIQDEEG